MLEGGMGSDEIERANIDCKPVCGRCTRCGNLNKGYATRYVFADWKKSEHKTARHSFKLKDKLTRERPVVVELEVPADAL